MAISRQVRRANERKANKKPKMNYSEGPNRHDRRSAKSFERRLPGIIKKTKIKNNG